MWKNNDFAVDSGLIEPTKGKIYIDGKLVNHIPANKRQVNTVFQDYALFPHLNVFENVAFGLRIKKVREEEIQKKVREALHFVNLEGMKTEKSMKCPAANGSG